VIVPVALLAGFLAGRFSVAGPASAAPARHVWVGRQGDVLRVPAAATRCVVSVEGGAPDLFCARMPRGRYTVSFFKSGLDVWRNGNPDKPAFSARWAP
jgi:hypothetical protein